MIAVRNAVFVAPIYNLKSYETKNGKPYIKFTVRAWEKQHDGNDKVDFFTCVAYSSAAEVIKKYFFDGKIMYLDCKITSYKDKDDQTRIEFIVNQFSFTGDNKGEGAA